MSQERFELKDILGNLKPRILEGSFVFTTSNDELVHLMKTFKPIATFREEEGITLVISKDEADKFNIKYDSLFRCISLGVHSSLNSYGLISSISSELTKKKISSNVFSGFYHDHIFVQADLADTAIQVINSLDHS